MMLSRKPLAFWLLAVLTSSCTSGASSTTVPLAPDFSAADEVLQSYVEEGRLAGVILMVAHRGEIAHFETYGSMDLEAQKPMRKDTIFRIYSMTKSITTAAGLMLYEEGRLELEAPVSQYIPELTRLKVYTDAGTHEAEREMTVRDLMLHTSGFTYGIFRQTAVDALYQEAKPLAARDLQQMVKILAGLPLMFDPPVAAGTTASQRTCLAALWSSNRALLSTPSSMSEYSSRSACMRVASRYRGRSSTDSPPRTAPRAIS